MSTTTITPKCLKLKHLAKFRDPHKHEELLIKVQLPNGQMIPIADMQALDSFSAVNPAITLIADPTFELKLPEAKKATTGKVYMTVEELCDATGMQEIDFYKNFEPPEEVKELASHVKHKLFFNVGYNASDPDSNGTVPRSWLKKVTSRYKDCERIPEDIKKWSVYTVDHAPKQWILNDMSFEERYRKCFKGPMPKDPNKLKKLPPNWRVDSDYTNQASMFD